VLRSIRARLTVLSTVVVLIVLAATAAALVGAQRSVLTDNVDEALARRTDAVTAQLDSGSLGEVIQGLGDDDAFAEVTDRHGTLVGATEPPVDVPALPAPTIGAPVSATVQVPGRNGEYRVHSELHNGLVVRAGTPLDDVNDNIAALTRGLMIAVPAVAVVLAGLLWILVGRVLRPVEAIRREVANITGKDLGRRVPEPLVRDEIAALARTMNLMLDRLESAAGQQRRFVGDASHELRTPLARIRAQLEVELAHPDPAERERTMQGVLREVDQLQRLIDDLLLLARTDDQNQARRHTVDLDDVVLRESLSVRASTVTTSNPVSLDTSRVGAAQVVGDAAQLTRVVRNLLDNAVQHGGSHITVTLDESETRSGTEAVLTIADDGDGIPPQLQERVFERFARVDEARAATDGGTGLGLAITRQLVTGHGGTVAVDAAHASGTRMVVRLPLAPTSPAGSPTPAAVS
jgi:signal transduction histidine kinase